MNPMKKTTAFLSLALAVALLSGCESARKAFSGDKNAPDEFAVYSRPPLSLPPNYRLRPPAPGTVRPQVDSAKYRAERAILDNAVRKGGVAKRPQGSTGVMALLRDAGALSATPGIRAIINEETSILSSQDQAFVDKLIFWVDDKEPGSTVVDARKEQKRIQGNQALGKPLNEGETPEIKRKAKRKGLLDF
ncbi:MAG: hypothetical protein CMM60_14715 [Rhodospirillaceae bacterium]|jgi:hypothetical protein|nr:hypothetical protein [Rhodospirillaceae bacterium]|tara:strand:+ start:3519 stop:4091 length:573 start_codon:yes stop_codon:yes gene_type:complete